MSKQHKATLRSSTRPVASLSAAANNKSVLGRKIGTTQQPKVQAVEGGADMSSVAASAHAEVTARAEAFAATWSEETQAALVYGADVEEERLKNAYQIMLDLQRDNGDAIAAGNDPIMELPAPGTKAPKIEKGKDKGISMNPRLWVQLGHNEPWPFDTWSEKVTQSQGGSRNENFSFYLLSIDASSEGKKDYEALVSVKEQLANLKSGKPLTGDYQSMKKDELETEQTRLENRRSTKLRNLRDAVSLHRQFTSFARFENNKKDWPVYPEFRILTKKDENNDDVLSGSRKPIRFAICTHNATGGIDREYKSPISKDTFLGYDADLFAHNIKQPGADCYTAVTSSAATEANNKAQVIKLPLGVESFLSVAGLMCGFNEKLENRSQVNKRLSKKDAKTGEFENEGEIVSLVELYLTLAEYYSLYGDWYDARNAKLAAAAAEAAKAKQQKTN